MRRMKWHEWIVRSKRPSTMVLCRHHQRSCIVPHIRPSVSLVSTIASASNDRRMANRHCIHRLLHRHLVHLSAFDHRHLVRRRRRRKCVTEIKYEFCWNMVRIRYLSLSQSSIDRCLVKLRSLTQSNHIRIVVHHSTQQILSNHRPSSSMHPANHFLSWSTVNECNSARHYRRCEDFVAEITRKKWHWIKFDNRPSHSRSMSTYWDQSGPSAAPISSHWFVVDDDDTMVVYFERFIDWSMPSECFNCFSLIVSRKNCAAPASTNVADTEACFTAHITSTFFSSYLKEWIY